YELLSGLPDTLGPKQSISVPFRVTCLTPPDGSTEGTGGGCKGYTKCGRITYGMVCGNGATTKSSTTCCFTKSKDCDEQTMNDGDDTDRDLIPYSPLGYSNHYSQSELSPSGDDLGGGGDAACYPESERKECYCDPCYNKGVPKK
ncbi:MAG: hypothetical protein GY847_35120, partial [Proteobacteria bacterium]|nr:hypothetical protein [Pseudomonadota bacterium]